MPRTSSWFTEKSCDVDGFSGSITCAWTAATPGTCRIASMVCRRRSPPAVNPAPVPIPAPATEICPRTKR